MTTEQSMIHVGIDRKTSWQLQLRAVECVTRFSAWGPLRTRLPASTGCSKILPGVGRLSQYATKRDLRDMVFIGRCERSVSNAVLSRPH